MVGRPVSGKCGSHNSYDVGLNRISLTSMSSGWLMAKSTQRAKLSAGIAYFFRSFRFSVPRWALRPAPGATTVGGKIELSAVLIFDASAGKRRLFPVRAPPQGLVFD